MYTSAGKDGKFHDKHDVKCDLVMPVCESCAVISVERGKTADAADVVAAISRHGDGGSLLHDCLGTGFSSNAVPHTSQL
jgi:hypothetical protein